MNYSRLDAKDYARNHMSGIWIAALNLFRPGFAPDEVGLLANIRHWIYDPDIRGLFIAGKQGEFLSMPGPERKRTFEIAVDEYADNACMIVSCSDQNFDSVIELAKHAQACGTEKIVVLPPMLHLLADPDDTVYNYYKTICEKVDIGIAMCCHPDKEYLTSPELCARMAELRKIVAIQYCVPRETYERPTHLAGNNIHVTTASEAEQLGNIIDWIGNSFSALHRPSRSKA